ncbi:MAG: single-stranded DNA-binding protein [Chitinophagia bacterium]|nr:single-stranded DNA-binding protein [Chitinophagia bacterium]NCA30637.1 single-stranded DNA-binding protein [Chitinophagia bacterium]
MYYTGSWRWFVLFFKGEFMNIVMLRGNLARDPEIRVVGDKQTSVANFTIAVSREFVKANGEQDKITSFIQCEAWDSGAEAIGSSFKKGDLVMVEGSLRNDSWEKDGVKHSTLKVRVNNFAKITKTKRVEKSADTTVAF